MSTNNHTIAFKATFVNDTDKYIDLIFDTKMVSSIILHNKNVFIYMYQNNKHLPVKNIRLGKRYLIDKVMKCST
jgi:hypothetical protein